MPGAQGAGRQCSPWLSDHSSPGPQALPTLPQELEEVLAVVGGRAMEEDEEGAEEPSSLPGNFAFYNTKASECSRRPDRGHVCPPWRWSG